MGADKGPFQFGITANGKDGINFGGVTANGKDGVNVPGVTANGRDGINVPLVGSFTDQTGSKRPGRARARKPGLMSRLVTRFRSRAR